MGGENVNRVSVIPPWLLLFAIIFSVFIGLGSGYYPANKAVREALAVIPDDRLLLETDSPYLSPVPWRGKRNEPAFTVFTVRHMAAARGMEPEELWQLCGDNARRFFGV